MAEYYSKSTLLSFIRYGVSPNSMLSPVHIERMLDCIPTVDAAPMVQRWTSVKDKQPPAAGWYLVFYNGNAMQVAFFKGKKWPFDNHYHKITHWMPLPEPPKMDGD